ncbi:ABC transporter permease [Spirochaeta cellobiosiphila]|uniref:ABC transporter permease n=1 Tax=Spirochaeta cellobiosiphila TaxID=504483 RepID=UPI0003F65896|nr:ABC transporter permease [Spirochaeta cellobiosiphila]
MSNEKNSVTSSEEPKADENTFSMSVKGSSLTQDAWRRLKKNKMAMFGLGIFIFYAFIAFLGPYILPIYSYKFQVIDHIHLPPSLTKTAGELWYEKESTHMKAIAAKEGRELNAEEKAELDDMIYRIHNETKVINGKTVKIHERHYLLGTDYLGRDLLSRIIYGGRISILVGLVGALVAVFIGIVLGALAGFMGGTVDAIISRVIDVMYSLPYMLMVIIFMAIFGQNIFNLFLALALVSWLTVARVVRGQIISLKNSEFVEAARSIGAGTWRIIFRHLLPNTLGVIIVFTTLRIPSFIMSESFLSFLGLGISAPMASWGTLLKDAIDGMSLFPWKLIYPAGAMILFLFSMNFLGDGLRDAFDPESRN